MNPDEVVQMCLDRGADDVVCNHVKSRKKQIRFANNEITASKLWDVDAMGIFVSKDKRIVVTSVKDESMLENAIDMVFKMANVLKPKEEYFGIAKGKYSYSDISDVEVDIVEEDIVEEAFSIADDFRAAGVIYNLHSSNEISTSSGLNSFDAGSAVELSVRMFADKLASGHSVSCARNAKSFKPAEACNEAREIAKMAMGPTTGKEGRYDVLLSPLCMGNLIDHISFQTSAYYVDSGLSFFKDKIGQQVANEAVSLHDDGTRKDGLGSGRFDDEGVPTKKSTIIEDGMLRTYLHNTSTARKHGVETTANAGLIAPEPTNMVLDAGDHSFEEMLSELKDGLYLTNNWYTRYQNYSTGDFSTIPRDGIFLVEGGEISRPIKEIRISDNMQRLLMNISALGKDTRHIHWWEAETPCFTPHVLIRDVNITRSTG